MVVHVGCCGWPVARARYFATFELVEVQETFYNLPRMGTVERWRAVAPVGFEFVLKAPQLITHEPGSPTYRRLRVPVPQARRDRYGAFKPTREVRAAWTETLALARALGSRIVLFQSPASFAPTPTHIRNLTAFFERAERGGLAFVWEPRGGWSDSELKTLFKRLDLIHCVDPWERRPVWGEVAYFRLHGKGGYHYSYSEAELRALGDLVMVHEESYVLFNNTGMLDDARRFLTMARSASQPRRDRVAG